MKNVLKVLAALAAIAGIVYVIATFGDKIVAWAKKILPTCPCKEECECETCECEAAAEEAPAAAEASVEEVIVEDAAPVAEETDFES